MLSVDPSISPSSNSRSAHAQCHHMAPDFWRQNIPALGYYLNSLAKWLCKFAILQATAPLQLWCSLQLLQSATLHLTAMCTAMRIAESKFRRRKSQSPHFARFVHCKVQNASCTCNFCITVSGHTCRRDFGAICANAGCFFLQKIVGSLAVRA